MIGMNEFEFERFLSAVTFKMLFSEDDKNLLIGIGVNPDFWPIKSKARLIAQEFLFHVTKNSFHFAQVMFSDKIEALEKSEIPDSIETIKILYHNNLPVIQAIELSRSIQLNPSKASELIDNYKSTLSVRNNSINLKDYTYEVIQNNTNLVESGKSKIIFKDFPLISDLSGGFNPGRISLLSAKSGFGKTKLAVNLAYSASRDIPVLYFNMEMTSYDFSSLFIQRSCKISNETWTSKSFLLPANQNRIINYQKEVSERKDIFIKSSSSLSMLEIEAECMFRLKDAENSYIIIDYDQKLDTNGYESEWMGMLKSLERLEALSKRLNAHITILVQGDDEGNPKSSKRSIQPASLVATFYRPNPDTYAVKCLKNRFGPNDWEVKVKYEPQYSLISEDGHYDKTKDDILVQKKLSTETLEKNKAKIKGPYVTRHN